MRAIATLLVGAVLLGSAPTLADDETVVLTNGDRITGEVESLADGVFHVKTAFGDLAIPKEKVAQIEFSRDPLSRFLPDEPAVQELVQALRGQPEDERSGEAHVDLLRTAMDLIDSYRRLGEGQDQGDRLEELRRRLEGILPRLRQRRTAESKDPEDPGK